MAISAISKKTSSVNYSGGSAIEKNTEYTMTEDKALVGYAQSYSGAGFNFTVNGVTVMYAMNNVQGYAISYPVFMLLKKGDKLKVTGEGQSLSCKLYSMTGG